MFWKPQESEHPSEEFTIINPLSEEPSIKSTIINSLSEVPPINYHWKLKTIGTSTTPPLLAASR
jgi:hypothetical protein